ncbi:uncharacterized protein LOC129584229 [Paramacrobiotus metropolitanus]|uniref:uncharacterized protein LOC129584229 n=1 Tax=Paramacrobiotus metropolitanus TaxID=2943436 RepID=UPI002446554A|nr:uncharacterized protein LOC129584229 [Paramacrobiotus metropolitanus]
MDSGSNTFAVPSGAVIKLILKLAASYFPIECDEAWEMYKKAVACFWTPEEINLSHDTRQWPMLSQFERDILGNVLAFFAASDGIVMENLAENFLCEVQLPEVRAFYAYQIFIENVHSETYSLLINTYFQDSEEKQRLLQAIINNSNVMEKAEWAAQYIRDKERSFGERLIAFACVEMIFFCGAFAVIFWFKGRGILPGLTYSNELIARDESQHVEFACWLYLGLVKFKIPPEVIYELVLEAVEIECRFWENAFTHPLRGLNEASMKTYVMFVADVLLKMLEMEPYFKVENPLPYMETISLEGKTNFFERRVSEYRKAHVGQGAEVMKEFTTEATF